MASVEEEKDEMEEEDFRDAKNEEEEMIFSFDLLTMEKEKMEEQKSATITKAASKLHVGSE